ncbi:MAG: aldehyde dehydrogenase family protein, partial [Oscillospiraceae bacterium]
MGLLIDVPVKNEITKAISLQRKFFLTGQTLPLDFRISMLKRLKTLIAMHEQDFLDALKSDLNKPECETYAMEIAMINDEICYMLKNIKKLVKPKKVPLAMRYFPSKGRIFPEPYGVSLIYSPWNYPLQLSLIPLIGSIAAGNCSVLRLSEFAVETSKLLSSIINKTFPENYIFAIYEGEQLNEKLLSTKVDKIFFTGSTRVGKIVMAAAATNLTPLTLELGGKSPCIVDKTANLEIAAKRIVWGKCLNAGQTCLAPDYLLIHSSVKEKFVEYVKKAVYEFYTQQQLLCDDYSIIVNDRNFRRLKNLILTQKILIGGGVDERTRKMEFTLLEENN